MDEKRVNYENVASLVESADNSPDESVGEIHYSSTSRAKAWTLSTRLKNPLVPLRKCAQSILQLYSHDS